MSTTQVRKRIVHAQPNGLRRIVGYLEGPDVARAELVKGAMSFGNPLVTVTYFKSFARYIEYREAP